MKIKEVKIVTNQTLTPSVCLDNNKNINNGAVKINGWAAIFLFAKVEAGGASWVSENGSTKYWRIPINAIHPDARSSPQDSFTRLLMFKDRLLVIIKLKKAASQSSHLFTVKSILLDQNILNVPKTNKISRESFRKLKLKLKFSLLVLWNIDMQANIPSPQ